MLKKRTGAQERTEQNMNEEERPDIIHLSTRYKADTSGIKTPAVRFICCMLGVLTLFSACIVSFADSVGIEIPVNGLAASAPPHSSEPAAESAEPPISKNEEWLVPPEETAAQPASETQSIAEAPHESEALPPTDHTGDHRITATDLSRNPAGKILIENSTSFSPDIDALLGSVPSWNPSGGTENNPEVTVTAGESTVLYSSGNNPPQVLIVHTHGTECYSTYPDRYLDSEIGFRTRNTDVNMISVGSKAARALAENGVSVLHCTIMHDAESYNDSYNYSARSIRALTEEYPSISYVLDLHRDAIQYDDGSLARPVTETSLGDTAQIMFVVGTNEMGANHPNWESNLSLAVRLQCLLNGSFGNIARPISLRGAAYNQQYTPGSILVEIGACGNTVEEAHRAAVLLAGALAEIVKNG